MTRFLRQLGKIETGMVSIPLEAPWAKEFLEEVVNFPSARHDDYVDSMIQFLRWTDTGGFIQMFDTIFPPRIIEG